MYLVGVISENKEIINFLQNKEFEQKIDFIDLDTKTIENFKNIKFEILLISNLEKYKKTNNFEKVISNSSISLINADIKDNLKVLDNIKGRVITYGFNPKSTITASSVNEGYISIYIQRIIEDVNNKIIEPIEYVSNIGELENVEISDVLGVRVLEKLLN